MYLSDNTAAYRGLRSARLLAVVLMMACLHNRAVADELTVAVWPEEVPGESSQPADFSSRVATLEQQNTSDRVLGVTRPELTVRLADDAVANGTSVLVCPGGGYNVLAWDKEGLEVAEWLNTLGVHAFVLKYRVPRRQPAFATPPLQDAQRAMRIIRSRAGEWKINPSRVGVLGFSAGGNLCVNLATTRSATYEPIDAVDQSEMRPNFMVPVYAAYLGANDDDQQLNSEISIDGETPPAFLVVTQDDKNRGIHAALLFAELTRAGVPAELHVFVKGGHGYGLRPTGNPVQTWPSHCAEWMRQMKLIPHHN